ncbi:MFS general substrate transporter [Mycena amicta]|nr:MFS general substrate transporter [Mycena amicta]
MAAAAASTERDPLLHKANADAEGRLLVGPSEISASTRRRILAGIWIGTFLGALNLTLVPTMIPAISSEFQKFHQGSWLGTANFLASCTFTPLYGRLCNVMGRRRAYQTAILFTAAGALACGLSPNMEWLIAARFVAGMGGGGVFTATTIIVSDMYSLRNRGLIQGIGACFNSLGMGLGGPLGGIITDLFGWRAAFLMQIPLFVASAIMVHFNINYVTAGKSKSAKEILKRIDYLGSFTLLIFVGSFLLCLSSRYNESLPWLDPRVMLPLVLAAVFFIAFLVVEILVAPEPVMPPALLRQRIPVLIGTSDFFVTACTFSVMYFFPMWFQVVTLESASTAGLHLMPNSVSLSAGSLFAGWIMHRTGRYKNLNLIFGLLPFFGVTFISLLREDSGWIQSWLSIIPFGFGNAVVLQTMLVALLAHLPESQMAVGTGFTQLFRGIGQVGGVAISSAIFQSRLDGELRRRFPPGSDELIMNIRRSSAVIRQLLPEQQRLARDSYAVSLKAVYVFAACSTFVAYLVRLAIPDQDLDKGRGQPEATSDPSARARAPESLIGTTGTAPLQSSTNVSAADGRV